MDLQLALPPSNDSNESYTFASPRPQHFKFRFPVIKYMFEKPSSGKAWKKLIQTCKYFYSKNPIYPVEYLKCNYETEREADGETFNPVENIARLWIYDKIGLYFNFEHSFLSSMIPKIEKCNLRFLNIYCQHLTFDEYSFLTLSGDLKRLELHCCTIKNSDGILVAFEQLFQNIPKLEYFFMECASNSSSMFKPDSFEKISQRLPESSSICVHGLREAFDFASIIDFLMKNDSLIIELKYDDPLSDGYIEMVENFIAQIIKTPPKRIPTIEFNEFSNSIYYKEYRQLFYVRDNHLLKYYLSPPERKKSF